MTGRHITLGALGVSAAVLFGSLAMLHAVRPEPAMGFAQTASAGGYVVTTSQFDEATELLLVLNNAEEAMNVYIFNPQRGRLELIQPPIELEGLGERDD